MDETGERQIMLAVSGMTCGHCVARVQKALDATAGVIQAKVDLASGRVDIRSSAATDPMALIAAVEEAGYRATATQS